MTCPVDRDRNRRRSRRYSCPRRRAAVTFGPRPRSRLVFQQSLEHTDGGMEGRPRRDRPIRRVTALGIAVPAAVVQLFLEQSLGESIAGFAEVRTDAEHASVYARLDLALEER